MKPKLHPDYHSITVQLTDGSSFATRSTYGKAGAVLKLDIDPLNHPAWTGGTLRAIESVSQVAKFNKRFATLGIKKD